MVGFANADGGELLVGVEDNGDITGLPDRTDFELDYLMECWKDGVLKKTPLANLKTNKIEINGKLIIYFSINRSANYIHQTSDGRCLQRRDLETVPITAEEIQFSRQETISQQYDRDFVDGASAADLNSEYLRTLADQISAGMSVEKCLQYLNLADFSNGFLRYRRASLILFANNPARWHPRLQIRILRVNGLTVKMGPDYNIASEKIVQGNILQILDLAWDALRPELIQTKFSGSAKFETKVMYPEFACREALINAIAHRDYSQEGRGVEIFIYDDRLEVVSPGGLLSSLKIEDLKRLSGSHQSRNSLIARVLREFGYMREVGEGMRRIFELMRSNELLEPELNTAPDTFTVTLSNKTLYSNEHLLWLENFYRFELTREQKSIIVLGYNSKHIAPNDIWTALGIVDTDYYRQVIYSMQKLGLLVSILTKDKAKIQARSRNVNIRDIPRYAIVIPSVDSGKDHINNHPTGKTKIEDKKSIDNFDQENRIFIGNTPGRFELDKLINFVRDLGIDGDITRSGRIYSPYAFLQLNQDQDIDRAISLIDGSLFMDRTLVARRAHPRPQNRPSSDS